jgi:hypothetical protein
MKLLSHSVQLALWMLTMVLMSGCATSKTDWNSRVGNYTYDQAVVEFGPPDKQAQLADGTIVAEWLTRRGYNRSYGGSSYGYYGPYGPYYGPVFPVETHSPDYFLRLTFDSEGRLKLWKSFAR